MSLARARTLNPLYGAREQDTAAPGSCISEAVGGHEDTDNASDRKDELQWTPRADGNTGRIHFQEGSSSSYGEMSAWVSLRLVGCEINVPGSVCTYCYSWGGGNVDSHAFRSSWGCYPSDSSAISELQIIKSSHILFERKHFFPLPFIGSSPGVSQVCILVLMVLTGQGL